MMKKPIEVKGTINVDKKGMSKVHAGGTCASAGTGIMCKSYTATQNRQISKAGPIVDTLIP